MIMIEQYKELIHNMSNFLHDYTDNRRLLATKVSMFALSGFSVALVGVTMFPDVLNDLSESLVALMHKYLLPN